MNGGQLPSLQCWGYGRLLWDEIFNHVDLRSNFATIMIARSPNLPELETQISVKWFSLVPVEKMHIIQSMRFEWPNDDNYDETIRLLDRVVQSQLKLHTVAVIPDENSKTSQRNLHDYLSRFSSIVRSSSETLRTITLDYRSALGLKNFVNRIPPLEKVVNLEFQMPSGKNALIARYLLRAPLAKMFPNVRTVSFSSALVINRRESNNEEDDSDSNTFPISI